MKVIYTDVLVIGAGLAGLRMAVGAKRRGHDSIILSLVPPKRSHSKAAQGGMQASLANVIKGVGDNEDVHFGDTVRGSDWGADQEVVRMFVNTAPKAVRELAAWGVPWSRITPGDRQVIINGEKVTITERKEAAGLIGQRDFGGTKKWRTCFVSDGTGHAMLNAVSGGYTYVRFWFTTHCASHRRYVNDCRRNLCRFLYAGGRRFGLYGETGRTFAS